MKLCLIFLGLLGLGWGFPNDRVEVKDLSSDLDEFVDLIPSGEIFALLFKFLDDTEVQHTITYMFGNEFKDIIAELDTIKEFTDVTDFLDEAGIPVGTFFENLRDILGITRVIRKTGKADLGGMKGLVLAISETIPWGEMKNLYDDKKENSEDFQGLIEDLTSNEFRGLVKTMIENERLREISAMLTAGGVDVAGLVRLIRELLLSK
ncbi:protein G12 [Arctopsyche grandis]|uniref:protein G12 n=1 Tax=Arctopsyche grandis TaxID=121162 RepID=UPI00406D9951